MLSEASGPGGLVTPPAKAHTHTGLSEKDPDTERGQPPQTDHSPASVDKENTLPDSTGLSRGFSSLRARRSDVGTILAHHQSIGDAESLASIDRPPSEEEKLPPSKIYRPLSFPVIAMLMPASVFGTLARLGILAIVNYDGKEIFPLAWVQGMGCLIMGFALGLKEPIGRFYGPLYTALTTGFCGSVTTFSGWQLDIFDSFINGTASHRDWFRDALDGVGKTVFTFAICLSAVTFGAHLSKLFLPYVPTLPPPSRPIRYSISAISVLIYAAAYPVYFRLPPRYRHEVTAALLFSFPGTLSRYVLSIFLNPRLHLFPLGTFIANMFGTAFLAMFQVLRSIQHPGPLSMNACDVLQGLADGYCGCLTTVSTFAAEVDALPPRQAWLYAVLSWFVSQVLIAVILGPSLGVGHVSRQVTCKFEQ